MSRKKEENNGKTLWDESERTHRKWSAAIRLTAVFGTISDDNHYSCPEYSVVRPLWETKLLPQLNELVV